MKLGWNQDILIKWCVKALNVLYDDRTLKCKISNTKSRIGKTNWGM